jgi:hypothetical protein
MQLVPIKVLAIDKGNTVCIQNVRLPSSWIDLYFPDQNSGTHWRATGSYNDYCLAAKPLPVIPKLIVELFLIRNILFYGLKTAVLLTRSYGK